MNFFEKILNTHEGIYILILSSIFTIIGLLFNLIPWNHNLVALLLFFFIFTEFSKLIIEMIIRPDAPIMVRFFIAGLIFASGREFYMNLLEKDFVWTIVCLFSTIILIPARHYAIYSTKERR